MPQLNAQTTVSGYSPMQWALGFQPQVPGLMLSEEITPQRLAGGASFEETLHKRNAARTCTRGGRHRQEDEHSFRRYAGQNRSLAVCH